MTEAVDTQAELNESVAVPEKDMSENIPGLEITWQQAQDLSWSDQFIKTLHASKQQYAHIHVLNVADSWYVIRSLNRREYRALLQTQAEILSKEAEKAADGANPDGVRATLNMITEEALAIRGTVWPILDEEKIRGLPSGVATTLNEAVMLISGYQGQPMPIKV